MLTITSTELKRRLGYYLQRAESEDIYVTKNKEVIAVISNPKTKAISDFLTLEGCLKERDDGSSYRDLIAEGIMQKRYS